MVRACMYKMSLLPLPPSSSSTYFHITESIFSLQIKSDDEQWIVSNTSHLNDIEP